MIKLRKIYIAIFFATVSYSNGEFIRVKRMAKGESCEEDWDCHEGFCDELKICQDKGPEGSKCIDSKQCLSGVCTLNVANRRLYLEQVAMQFSGVCINKFNCWKVCSGKEHVALSDDDIYYARDLWFTDMEKAEERYGNIECWDTSQVTNMAQLFNCTETYGKPYFNEDLSCWDTSKVTDMTEMFMGATSFNDDISEWNVGNVKSTKLMFYKARSFNQDLSGWSVGDSVTDMSGMFHSTDSFNQDLSAWNVDKVTDFGFMFVRSTGFDQKLCWDIPKTTWTKWMLMATPGCIKSDCCADCDPELLCA